MSSNNILTARGPTEIQGGVLIFNSDHYAFHFYPVPTQNVVFWVWVGVRESFPVQNPC